MCVCVCVFFFNINRINELIIIINIERGTWMLRRELVVYSDKDRGRETLQFKNECLP